MLIVFEGIHSAGKSSQAAALTSWLREQGENPVATEWNSSDAVGPRITQLKIDNLLPPVSMVLLEAADLAHRYERGLRSALAAGRVVVSDRYYYSTLARALPRGVAEQFVRACFAFAPEPDLVFHVRATGAATLQRRCAADQSIGGHMAGVDYRPVADLRTAFVEQQDRTEELYGSLLPPGTVRLPSAEGRAELHARVVAEVTRVLKRVSEEEE